MCLRWIIVISILCFVQCESDHWDYAEYGPDVWDEYFPQCNGTSQSPINIRTKCTIQRNFPSFTFSIDHLRNLSFLLINNGHTIQAKTNSSLFINGAELDGNFVFDSFHVHWGPNHRSGSEHQINGEKFSGESHFVYQNPATNQRAVLAFLMKSRAINSTEKLLFNNNKDQIDQWKRFFDGAHQLNSTVNSTKIFLNLNLLMPTNLKEFWRYRGSLTTPPCTENVIWTIFRYEISLFDDDFQTVRHDLFYQSYRGPQPLFNRQVYRSFPNETLSNIPDEQCCFQPAPSSSTFHGSFFFVSYVFLCMLTIDF